MSKIIFNHTAHKDMWDWISKNLGKCKQDWPIWEIVPYIPMHYCFACDFAEKVVLAKYNGNPFLVTYEERCASCPFGDYSSGITPYDDSNCLNGLWNAFVLCLDTNADYAEACKIAAKIRDLPIRSDFNYDKYAIF